MDRPDHVSVVESAELLVDGSWSESEHVSSSDHVQLRFEVADLHDGEVDRSRIESEIGEVGDEVKGLLARGEHAADPADGHDRLVPAEGVAK